MSQPDDFDGTALALIVAFASTRSNPMARHRLTTSAADTGATARRASRSKRNARRRKGSR